ncbi:hypothetical protein EII11_05185 [Schaalia canis]|uniref:Prealbumin-like fold domain-containing protein n=1 Tax=Schaalia canis TaxID=100469 RepID=A0A3P1SEE0_9ACTO|nr:hypothetical protein EII11_05185 [Schaalia canis]
MQQEFIYEETVNRLPGRPRTLLLALMASATLFALPGLHVQGISAPVIVRSPDQGAAIAAESNGEISPANDVDAPESDSLQSDAEDQNASTNVDSTEAAGEEENGADNSAAGADAQQSDSERDSSDDADELTQSGERAADAAQSAPAPQRSGFSGFRRAARSSAALSTDINNPNLSAPVFATGGSGRFKDVIQWMQWSDPNFYANATLKSSSHSGVTRPDVPRSDGVVFDVMGNDSRYPHSAVRSYVRNIGTSARLITSCQLTNLDHRSLRQGPSYKAGPVAATVPGNWQGDSLDNMYNIGGQGTQNRMVIGLGNGQPGINHGKPGYGATPRFNVECSAALWQKDSDGEFSSPQPVPIDGLVVADAESAGYSSGSDEWVEATTPSSTKWHLLDRFADEQRCPPTYPQRQPSRSVNATADAVFAVTQAGAPAGQSTIRIVPNGNECASGSGTPGAVLFAQGTSNATVRLQGNGVQAVALGLITLSDLSDAPLSYGAAGAFFHPRWTSPLTASTTNLTRGIPLTTMEPPATRLGALVTHEVVDLHTPNADRDDDDGITNNADLTFDTAVGAIVSRQVACTGPGTIAGWIDWNVNGTFDEGEKSNEVDCQGSAAMLTWTVPANAVRAVRGEAGSAQRSYMRIRIANPADTSFGPVSPLSATQITSSGEVEDYEVQIYVPTLEVQLEVDNSEGWTDTPLPPENWRVSAQQGTSTQTGYFMQAQGRIPRTSIASGNFALKTAGSGPGGWTRGYLFANPPGWVCTETPGTVRPGNRPFAARVTAGPGALSVPRADRISCRVAFRPVYAELRWSKVDSQGNFLGGSEWQLSGPQVPADTIIRDCDSRACTRASGPYIDKDPAKGKFHIIELRWGTHSITETRAPAGYAINANPTVQAELAPAATIASIVNYPREPIVIPLTGGTAADMYTYVGAASVLIACVSGVVVIHRTRRRG